jgi:hypothetical protein
MWGTSILFFTEAVQTWHNSPKLAVLKKKSKFLSRAICKIPNLFRTTMFGQHAYLGF